MLMNGKEVNNLILNGKTFVAQDFVPSLYTFPKSSGEDVEYDLTITNKVPIFLPHKSDDYRYKHYVALRHKRAIVIRIIDDGKDKYALASVESGSHFSSGGSSAIPYKFCWIKVAAFGGEMIRVENELYPDAQLINRCITVDLDGL